MRAVRQEGDIFARYAPERVVHLAAQPDVSDLARDVGFAPATPLEMGVERFVAWYHFYYHGRPDARTSPDLAATE